LSPEGLAPVPPCQGLSPASATGCSSGEMRAGLCHDGRVVFSFGCDGWQT
jgi:hypothetical protein